MSEKVDPKEMSLCDFYKVVQSKSPYELFGEDYSGLSMSTKLILLAEPSLVLRALYGEKMNLNEHVVFMNFLLTTPAGNTLAAQASIAWEGPKRWTRFSHAIKQSGFVYAWLSYVKISKKTPVDTVIEWIKEDFECQDELDRVVAKSLKKELPTPGTPEFKDYIDRAKTALESKRRRGSKARCSLYDLIVEHYFLADALWCRTTSEIACDYFEVDGENYERHTRGITKAFRNLGLSSCRRPDALECPDTEV